MLLNWAPDCNTVLRDNSRQQYTRPMRTVNEDFSPRQISVDDFPNVNGYAVSLANRMAGAGTNGSARNSAGRENLETLRLIMNRVKQYSYIDDETFRRSMAIGLDANLSFVKL